MKLRLGDTVIELANIAYARKRADHLVNIHFVGVEKALNVSCNGDTRGMVQYEGRADDLLSLIHTSERKK